MPLDSHGNRWPNELLCRWWEATRTGNTSDIDDYSGSPRPHWEARRQIKAEEWALRNGRTELFGDFRNPPGEVAGPSPPPSVTLYPSHGHNFTSLEAAVYYSHHRRIGLTSYCTILVAMSPEQQNTTAREWHRVRPGNWEARLRHYQSEQIMPIPESEEEDDRPILRTSQRRRNPWRHHVEGEYIQDDEGEYPDDYLYYVHGYGFDSERARDYFTTMLNTWEHDNDQITDFVGWSLSEQDDWMDSNPLRHRDSPAWENDPEPELQNAPIRRDGSMWDTVMPDGSSGWAAGTGAAAQFAANMAARGIGINRGDLNSSNPLYRFLTMTGSEQIEHMREHPEEGAPFNPSDPTMPINRNRDGTFARTPKPKKGVRLGNILYQAILKAVNGKKGDVKPKSKRPRSTPDQIMKHFKGKLFCPELFRCFPSGKWVQDGLFCKVWTNPASIRTTEYWDSDHAESNAWICHGTGRWYSNAWPKITVVEHRGRYYSEAFCRDRGWVVWTSDGQWHDRQPPLTMEQRQEQIRQMGGNHIPQYHHIKAPWRDTDLGSSELKFGVELEIQSKFRRDICTLAEKLGLIGEQDGSLCRETGLEIVAPPYTYEEIADPEGVWQKFLNEIVGKGWQVKGWKAGKDYGMHVNVSRRALSQQHQIDFIKFIHDSQTLCEKVAGREQDRWARFLKKQRDDSALMSPDKYEAACCRGHHRIEVRIFRSTVAVEGFMRNVEFTASSVEFTRNPKEKLEQGRFLEWIGDARIGKKYPNLAEFLKDKKEEIKTAPPPKKTKIPQEDIEVLGQRIQRSMGASFRYTPTTNWINVSNTSNDSEDNF